MVWNQDPFAPLVNVSLSPGGYWFWRYQLRSQAPSQTYPCTGGISGPCAVGFRLSVWTESVGWRHPLFNEESGPTVGKSNYIRFYNALTESWLPSEILDSADVVEGFPDVNVIAATPFAAQTVAAALMDFGTGIIEWPLARPLSRYDDADAYEDFEHPDFPGQHFKKLTSVSFEIAYHVYPSTFCDGAFNLRTACVTPFPYNEDPPTVTQSPTVLNFENTRIKFGIISRWKAVGIYLAPRPTGTIASPHPRTVWTSGGIRGHREWDLDVLFKRMTPTEIAAEDAPPPT